MLTWGFCFSPLTEHGNLRNKTPNLVVSPWCLKLGGMNVAQRNSTPLVEDGKVYHMGKWITCWFVWASITGSWLDPMFFTSFFFPVENKIFFLVLHLENNKYTNICNSIYTILHCFKSITSTLFNILVVHWTLYAKLFLLLEPNCWRQSATSKRHCHLTARLSASAFPTHFNL